MNYCQPQDPFLHCCFLCDSSLKDVPFSPAESSFTKIFLPTLKQMRKVICFIKSHTFSLKQLHTSQVAQQARVVSLFQQHEATRSICTPPCIGCQSIAGFPSSIKFTGINLCTWVERGNVRVKTLAPARAQTQATHSGMKSLTMRPLPPLPLVIVW